MVELTTHAIKLWIKANEPFFLLITSSTKTKLKNKYKIENKSKFLEKPAYVHSAIFGNNLITIIVIFQFLLNIFIYDTIYSKMRRFCNS